MLIDRSSEDKIFGRKQVFRRAMYFAEECNDFKELIEILRVEELQIKENEKQSIADLLELLQPEVHLNNKRRATRIRRDILTEEMARLVSKGCSENEAKETLSCQHGGEHLQNTTFNCTQATLKRDIEKHILKKGTEFNELYLQMLKDRRKKL